MKQTLLGKDPSAVKPTTLAVLLFAIHITTTIVLLLTLAWSQFVLYPKQDALMMRQRSIIEEVQRNNKGLQKANLTLMDNLGQSLVYTEDLLETNARLRNIVEEQEDQLEFLVDMLFE